MDDLTLRFIASLFVVGVFFAFRLGSFTSSKRSASTDDISVICQQLHNVIAYVRKIGHADKADQIAKAAGCIFETPGGAPHVPPANP